MGTLKEVWRTRHGRVALTILGIGLFVLLAPSLPMLIGTAIFTVVALSIFFGMDYASDEKVRTSVNDRLRMFGGGASRTDKKSGGERL